MQGDLRGLCEQFEEVTIASLLPRSLFGAKSPGPDGTQPELGAADRDLFSQAFAAAFERAGGMGLSRELLRDLKPSP
jgi:hypothetical protein